MSNTAIDSQLNTEETYSRKFIKSMIAKDINESLEHSNFEEPYHKACKAVEDYLTTTHTYDNGKGPIEHTSKNQRIQHVLSKCIFSVELVEEIFTIVLPMEKKELIQNAISKLAYHLEFDDIFLGVATAAELLGAAEACGLYSISKHPKTGQLEIVSNVLLAKETRDFIEQTKYLPPMVVEPRKLTCSTSSPFLRIPGSSLILKNNHHKDPINIDALNCANSVKLALDENMLQYSEESKKPLDTLDKQKSFKQMQKESTQVYNDILEQGNEFYLTHKYDFRGRMYSQGYHINSQGTAYKKSVINLAEQYEIGN